MIMRSGKWWARKGKLNEAEGDAFHYHFWQVQPAGARFDAAWDLFRHYQENVLHRDESEYRLDRTVVTIKRAWQRHKKLCKRRK